MRGEVGCMRVVWRGVKGLNRNGIMGPLDKVQLRLQGPALSLHLLMVGTRRRLVELDNDVYRGAVLAALYRVKIVGQFVLLAVSRGRSGSHQCNQDSEGKPPAPS